MVRSAPLFICQIKEPESQEPLLERAVQEWIELVLTLLPLFDGYECNRQQNGSFNLAFATIERAVCFAVTAQRRLIDAKMAMEVAALPGCEEVFPYVAPMFLLLMLILQPF
jgi:hypothetical protein